MKIGGFFMLPSWQHIKKIPAFQNTFTKNFIVQLDAQSITCTSE